MMALSYMKLKVFYMPAGVSTVAQKIHQMAVLELSHAGA